MCSWDVKHIAFVSSSPLLAAIDEGWGAGVIIATKFEKGKPQPPPSGAAPICGHEPNNKTQSTHHKISANNVRNF